MVNIAIEANALCCLLPLLAFILLALQFCKQSLFNRLHNSSLSEPHDEVPYSMGSLIAITNPLLSQQRHDSSDHSSLQPCFDQFFRQQAKDDARYFNRMKRQAFDFGQRVLNGCNAGLARMLRINKVYFNSRRMEGSAKFSKQQKKRKNTVIVSGEWFQPTRLVTIVQGLQY